MKKLKLIRKSLDELAMSLPAIGEQEQQGFIGGGDGSQMNPWTYDEYSSQYGYFAGGWVDFGEDGVRYVQPGYAFTPPDSGVATLASSYVGVSEANNDELIRAWLAENRYGNGGASVSTPWCAAFVSSMLSASGISNPRSCAVNDFENWGTGTTSPKVGDVAIFKNPHHVGIVAAVDGNSVTIVSGNSMGPGDAAGNPTFVTSKTYYGLDNFNFRTY